MPLDIEFVIGVALTLAIFSMLWKENVVSRTAEHLALGVGGGYAVVLSVKYVYDKGVAAVAKGDATLIVVLVLGFMLYSRFIKVGQVQSLVRFPIAIMIGTALGLASRATINAQILQQILAAINLSSNAGIAQIFDFLVALIGTVCVLFYFLFMANPKGRVGPLKTLGRYMLLIGFSASFGNIVLGLFSRLLDRLIYLIGLG